MAKVRVEVLRGQVDYSHAGEKIEVDSAYVERLVNDGFVKVLEVPAEPEKQVEPEPPAEPTKPASKTKEKTK
ncbi:hypothetical protein [Listeria seeligeri]|uniref:hypothetical protein n=1 Tax=Listeria seeligeri TaxID=1640 RepID=UPI00164E6E00|nr:hypothetical protein [Listeria seeligeri]MBC6130576.1 hypothetical protein [Listeria seeligeri]MBF2370318.1 hypothetical protein [Listeria seeligeri]MBF2390516.1 hypothetical protein [Listeria seeligeri]